MAESKWIDTSRDRRAAVREGWRKHPLLMARAKVTPRKGMSLRVESRPTSKADVLRRLVELPTSTWTYAWEDESVVHMGPMSQDFARAFGLGSRDDVIEGVDESGVLIVALQALHAKVVKLEARIAELETRGAPG